MGVRFVWIDLDGNEAHDDLVIPGHLDETNNQAEILACAIGLEAAISRGFPPTIRKTRVVTDSTYVVNNYKNALFRWPNTKWKKQKGAPVLNVPEWKELRRQYRRALERFNRVEIVWVKGHSRDLHNRAVDKLAKKSAREALGKPLHIVSKRRKITSETAEPGIVPMTGQRMTIRIITTEYLREQKLWRAKYEVVSRKSKYRGKVDWICSKDRLDRHTYYVKVNSEHGNPMVTKIIRDLTPRQLEKQ